MCALSAFAAAVEPPRGDFGEGRTLEAPFTDRAEAGGLDFVHFNGMSGEMYFPEMTGAGGALLDYDDDGDLDVYLVQGSILGPGKTLADALFPPRAAGPPRDRLFRNDLTLRADGSTALKFVDVTDAAGLRALGYGMGVATGDYDNDGDVDLYVTNFGPNQMWRNNGDGTFADVTAATGTDDPRWSTSASFFDFDRDGFLDLFVANYVTFDLVKNPRCFAPSSRRDYCGPADFAPQSDRLFRNKGDGTFEDVSSRAIAAQKFGAGLGVIATDFNRDGFPDIYVANDGLPNQLWINQKDGTFRDEALLAGVAVNREGKAEASMGVDAADFDGDGDDDLFMTHLRGESNTVFVNDGRGMFEDRTIETGLGSPSLPYTSFGTAWFDYDNDGWLDLLVLNGEVRTIPKLADAGDRYPLHQPNQFFRNVGGKRFQEVTAQAGQAFAYSEVSRGAAFGDVDNDGDVDVLILNNNGRARLLINNVGRQNHWLGLRLTGRKTERDMLGAEVTVILDGALPLVRRVSSDGSYCSASDPRVLVGLGNSKAVKTVRVRWPDGETQEFPGLVVDRYQTLRQRPSKPAKTSK